MPFAGRSAGPEAGVCRILGGFLGRGFRVQGSGFIGLIRLGLVFGVRILYLSGFQEWKLGFWF